MFIDLALVFLLYAFSTIALCVSVYALWTLKEVEELVREIFATWIIKFLNRYSFDYPHLQYNWENMTQQFNIKH